MCANRHLSGTALLAAALAVAVASCAARPTRVPAPTTEISVADATIEVINHHWLDVTIFLLPSDGTRTRIGAVSATARQTFTLPRRLLLATSAIRFVADPIGNRAGEVLTSESIDVRPGSAVVWTLETDLRRSTITVY